MNDAALLAFSADEWSAVKLTIIVSAAATALGFLPGVLLGLWLARTSARRRILAETLVSIPLVVPPVVIGFLLLILLHWLQQNLGIALLFTPAAAAIASATVALPLLVRTVRAAAETIDPRLETVAATLGASRLRILMTITAPLAWRGVVGGTMLAWARAAGEFGATMVVAGNMAGRTRTMPLAIWTNIQADRPVLGLALLAILLSAAAVLASECLIGQRAKRSELARDPRS